MNLLNFLKSQMEILKLKKSLDGTLTKTMCTFWRHWKMGQIIRIKDMFTKSPPILKLENGTNNPDKRHVYKI